jgi:hypothetical protein
MSSLSGVKGVAPLADAVLVTLKLILRILMRVFTVSQLPQKRISSSDTRGSPSRVV